MLDDILFLQWSICEKFELKFFLHEILIPNILHVVPIQRMILIKNRYSGINYINCMDFALFLSQIHSYNAIQILIFSLNLFSYILTLTNDRFPFISKCDFAVPTAAVAFFMNKFHRNLIKSHQMWNCFCVLCLANTFCTRHIDTDKEKSSIIISVYTITPSNSFCGVVGLLKMWNQLHFTPTKIALNRLVWWLVARVHQTMHECMIYEAKNASFSPYTHKKHQYLVRSCVCHLMNVRICCIAVSARAKWTKEGTIDTIHFNFLQ